MKEQPILFSGEMVKAILDGRKTKTRRIPKHQPPHWVRLCENAGDWFIFEGVHPKGECGRNDCYCIATDLRPEKSAWTIRSPYVVGDRLWVRETFAYGVNREICDTGDYQTHSITRAEFEKWRDHAFIVYKAEDEDEEPLVGPWRPSIFMPRWASRITLEVTGVRVERLQDMSDDDAIAEGIQTEALEVLRVEKFRTLWDFLNGKRAPWASNPWVWVIEFKKVEVNA